MCESNNAVHMTYIAMVHVHIKVEIRNYKGRFWNSHKTACNIITTDGKPKPKYVNSKTMLFLNTS